MRMEEDESAVFFRPRFVNFSFVAARVNPNNSFFLKWAKPGLFSVYFRSSHTTNIAQIQIL